MCTCIKWNNNNNTYFGRTLDDPADFNQRVVITGRNYPIHLSSSQIIKSHYAIIGMATIIDDYPLYADGMNEYGLCMASLLFRHHCHYFSYDKQANNVSSYEFIIYILSQCKNVSEAKELLKNLNMVDFPFSNDLPLIPQHFMISDYNESIVIESTKSGLNVYTNNYNTMTNNPPFTYREENIKKYMQLTVNCPKNTFSSSIELTPYGEGMGSMFLPGDYSSTGRFVRAAFLLNNSIKCETESASVIHFFKILQSVSLIKGIVHTIKKECDYTHYTCCMNANLGIYYYKTYNNTSINAINLNNENLNSKSLKIYELIDNTDIYYQN